MAHKLIVTRPVVATSNLCSGGSVFFVASYSTLFDTPFRAKKTMQVESEVTKGKEAQGDVAKCDQILQKDLWRAAQRGDVDTVRDLVTRLRLRVNCILPNPAGAVSVAALNDHAACVEAIASSLTVSKLLWFRKDLLLRAACRAASAGSMQVLRRLAELRAPLEVDQGIVLVVTGYSLPPFLWAAHVNQTRAMQFLIDAKTDVHRKLRYYGGNCQAPFENVFANYAGVDLSVTQWTAALGCRSGVLRLAHANVDLHQELFQFQRRRTVFHWDDSPLLSQQCDAVQDLLTSCIKFLEQVREQKQEQVREQVM
jgi:hypothetical protein